MLYDKYCTVEQAGYLSGLNVRYRDTEQPVCGIRSEPVLRGRSNSGCRFQQPFTRDIPLFGFPRRVWPRHRVIYIATDVFNIQAREFTQFKGSKINKRDINLSLPSNDLHYFIYFMSYLSLKLSFMEDSAFIVPF